jgi:hypothetical protein
VTALLALLLWFAASVVAAPVIGCLLFGRPTQHARPQAYPDGFPALTSAF